MENIRQIWRASHQSTAHQDSTRNSSRTGSDHSAWPRSTLTMRPFGIDERGIDPDELGFYLIFDRPGDQ
jgi:hypothetical protein